MAVIQLERLVSRLELDTHHFREGVKSAEGATKKFSAGMKLAGAAGAAAFIKLGVDSVHAFERAEKSQVGLEDALDKFPKLADTSAVALEKLNDSLGRKTRFDHVAAASAEAVLARFDLTGKQIEKLLPLVADYAAKTGQELPAAATTLGKALLGNTRALKTIGVSLPKAGAATKALARAQREAEQSEHGLRKARERLAEASALRSQKDKITLADNFRLRHAQDAVKEATERHRRAQEGLGEAQRAAGKQGSQLALITHALTDKVGGLAEKEGKTLTGRMQILGHQFEDVKEKVGAALVPALTKLADVGLKVIAFIQRNADTLGPLAIALGAVTTATWVFNAALAANPFGLIIGALTLVGIAIYKFRRQIADVAVRAVQFLVDKLLAAAEWIVRGFAFAFGWIPGIGPKLKRAAKRVEEFRDHVNAALDGIKSHKTVSVKLKFQVEGGQNVLRPFINGKPFIGPVAPFVGPVAARAAGGPVLAGRPYLVGERGPELMVPRVSGTIVPHGRTGSGTVNNFSINISAPGARRGDREAIKRAARQGAEEALEHQRRVDRLERR